MLRPASGSKPTHFSGPQSRRLTDLKTDTDLDLLPDRPEFKALVAKIGASPKPK